MQNLRLQLRGTTTSTMDCLDSYFYDEDMQDIKKNLHKCSFSLPTIPKEINDVLRSVSFMLPRSSTKEEFSHRPPSLGFTSEDLDLLRKHCNHPLYEPEQQILIFRIIRRFMLLMLIPCSGASTFNHLLDILEDELRSGTPAKVPMWYWLTIGSSSSSSSSSSSPPSGSGGDCDAWVGYKYCNNKGCLKTEDPNTTFLRCSRCKVPFYCSRNCQVFHWRNHHKGRCDKEALYRRQSSSRQVFMQHCLDSGISINKLDRDCLLFYRGTKNSFNADDVLNAIRDDPQGKWKK